MNMINENNNGIDKLVYLLRIIKKRILIIVLFTVFSILAALILNISITPVYEATSSLRIKQVKGLENSLLKQQSQVNPMELQQLITTYMEILRSRFVVTNTFAKVYGELPESLSYEDMLELIKIKPIKESYIIKVIAHAEEGMTAKLLADTLVENFFNKVMSMNQDEQSGFSMFIKERLDEAKKDLQHAEEALRRYKQTHKIISSDEETKSVVEHLNAINKIVAKNQIDLAAAQAKLVSIKNQLSMEEQNFVKDSPKLKRYKEKIAQFQAKLVRVLQQYSDSDPKVLNLRKQIETETKKLNSEIQTIIKEKANNYTPVIQELLQKKLQLESEINAILAEKEEVSKISKGKEEDVAKLPLLEQELTKLIRDVDVAQEIYITLAKRNEEARINQAMTINDVQIIDKAVAAKAPIKPNKRLNMIISIFLGLFISIGLVLLIETVNKTIATVDDVKHYLDLPVFGSIPDFNDKLLAREKQKQLKK